MSNLIGFFVCAVLSLATVAALFRVGIQDGDLPGDALVRTRLLRTAGQERGAAAAGVPRGALSAEIDIDNPGESPIMASARVRAASVFALLFVEPGGRRTARAHRDRLAGYELLGAVDAHGAARFLVPAELPGWVRPPRALRVTVVVDQVGRRTRVITSTLRVNRALDGVLPAASDAVTGR